MYTRKIGKSLKSSARNIVSIGALVVLTGCTSLLKTAALIDVHESFDEQNYTETLAHIRKAEYLSDLDPLLLAELIYIKARSFEAMGQEDESIALYSHLVSVYKSSQYSSLAKIRLK